MEPKKFFGSPTGTWYLPEDNLFKEKNDKVIKTLSFSDIQELEKRNLLEWREIRIIVEGQSTVILSPMLRGIILKYSEGS